MHPTLPFPSALLIEQSQAVVVTRPLERANLSTTAYVASNKTQAHIIMPYRPTPGVGLYLFQPRCCKEFTAIAVYMCMICTAVQSDMAREREMSSTLIKYINHAAKKCDRVSCSGPLKPACHV